jgi:putative ABC transport system permease protein
MSRSQNTRTPMLLRMMVRAAVLRKGSAISALTATVVAAAAATAMLNLFVDVQAKLQKEFRNFGANIVIEAPAGKNISAESLAKINSAVAGRGLAVPIAYAVARTWKDQPIVVAGVDFDLARRLNPWWSVSSWPHNSGEALVGVRAAQVLAPNGGEFDLAYVGHAMHLRNAGTVRTGAGEDSRVYLSLADFHSWSGLEPSVVEIAVSGSPYQISSVVRDLQATIPGTDVRPVRQVSEGEARIMGKTRSTLLFSAAFIVTTAALCVLATLMGWVFDRRRDFATMKALGASDRLIAMFVAGEAAVLGLVGAIPGFALGTGIAAWIGRANFHAPVSPRLSIFPPVLVGAIMVTLISALLPLQLLRRIQPAMILRGE